MSLVPVYFGPMQYLPLTNDKYTAIKYLGYNWFLCKQHLNAIARINQASKDVLQDTHIWSKSYHMAMIVFEAIPIIGHIVAALEALFHRVEVDKTYHNLADKANRMKCYIVRENTVKGLNYHEVRSFLHDLEDDYSLINNAPPEYFSNVSIAYEVVGTNGKWISKLPEEIQKNRSVAFRAVRNDISAFNLIDEKLQKDRGFLLACVEEMGETFFNMHVPAHLKSDYIFCLQAAARNATVYPCLPLHFQEQKQMILETFTSYMRYIETWPQYEKFAKVFLSVPKWVRNDSSLILQILKRNGLVLQYLNAQQRKDPNFVLTAVENNYKAYLYADEELKKNTEFFLKALEKNIGVFEYAPVEIRKNKEIVLKVLAEDGMMLKHVHSSLLPDREVNLKAVSQNEKAPFKHQPGKAYKYIHPMYQEDFEIASTAIENSPGTRLIKHMPISLRSNKEFMLKAVPVWGGALYYALGNLKKDKELVLAATRHDGAALLDADKSLKIDKSFVLQVLKETKYPERAWPYVLFKDDEEFKTLYQQRLDEKKIAKA